MCIHTVLSLPMGYIAASIVASAVTIDVEHASRTIPAATLGCHYSPLDHQLYVLYQTSERSPTAPFPPPHTSFTITLKPPLLLLSPWVSEQVLRILADDV